ncbi:MULTISPECIES: hypothetical protein [Microbacterium]|uniref:hypothetical protein n=1 Tax=Microbacterium TaxID=33882 RepID=UPI0027801E5E|nr:MULTISPECIES: hypothetical protein [Microbacterium]MDQ1082768.1 hypothetical protein [Microbacterium sp. SORGH_AS_0344]MDQ1168463.1 hypothetical protein [Microbacterium proteolyticum]
MTAPRPSSLAVAATAHEHAWRTESMHLTSEGRVRYVRCTGCAARRIDLDAPVTAPPTPLTRTLG